MVSTQVFSISLGSGVSSDPGVRPQVSLMDLQPIDLDVHRGSDSEANLASFAGHDRDTDVAIDHNRLSNTSRQY
jgi:hypothetical protein